MRLELARVPYGKLDTPIEDREYKIRGQPNCPVGNIEEWKDYARNNFYTKLAIFDKDGNREVEV